MRLSRPRDHLVVLTKPMTPERFFCLAHHVACRLLLLGLNARLVAAHFVSLPHGRHERKNDASGCRL